MPIATSVALFLSFGHAPNSFGTSVTSTSGPAASGPTAADGGEAAGGPAATGAVNTHAKPPATTPPSDAKGKAKPETSPVFLPLVSISGTTDKEGALKVAPSFYITPGTSKNLGLLLAPFFRASTKNGSAEVPLTRVADTPGLGFGGIISFYGLYSQAAPISSCGGSDTSEWSNLYCDQLNKAILECEKATGWNPLAKEGANCAGENESFCTLRKETDMTYRFANTLCPTGQAVFQHWLDGQQPFQEHRRRQQPKFVVTVGAAGQPASFSYLFASDTNWTKQEGRAWMVDAGLSGAVMTKPQWRPGLSLTVDFTLSYAGRSTAASKTGKWCIPEAKPFTAGDQIATIDVCSEAPLGAPTRSHQLIGSLLFGGIDVTDRRYRFAFGPSFALAPYQSYFAGIEAPVLIRLTPEAWRSYTGGYSGVLRIRPVLGALGTSTGVTLRALLVLELQGLRSLFGDRAFSWM